MEVAGRVMDIDLGVADALVVLEVVEREDIPCAVCADLEVDHIPSVEAVVGQMPIVVPVAGIPFAVPVVA